MRVVGSAAIVVWVIYVLIALWFVYLLYKIALHVQAWPFG